jgi:hypothetical protein
VSISGKHVALKIGDLMPVLVPGVQSWEGEHEADELDGTTAEDEGFDNPDDGLHKCTIQATLVIDITTGSFVAIKTGTLISDFKAYADIDAADPIYHLPVAKVFRSKFRGEIKGRVTYDVTIKSKGAFVVNEPN